MSVQVGPEYANITDIQGKSPLTLCFLIMRQILLRRNIQENRTFCILILYIKGVMTNDYHFNIGLTPILTVNNCTGKLF